MFILCIVLRSAGVSVPGLDNIRITPLPGATAHKFVDFVSLAWTCPPAYPAPLQPPKYLDFASLSWASKIGASTGRLPTCTPPPSLVKTSQASGIWVGECTQARTAAQAADDLLDSLVISFLTAWKKEEAIHRQEERSEVLAGTSKSARPAAGR